MDKLKWLKLKKNFFKVFAWSILSLGILLGIISLTIAFKKGESFGSALFGFILFVGIGGACAWQYGFKKEMNLQSEILHYEALNKIANK